MAFLIKKFPLSSADYNITRSLRYLIKSKHIQFSTSQFFYTAFKKDTPIKYTTHAAAKVSIGEIFGLRKKKKDITLLAKKYVFMGSAVLFFLYFCVLRKENDIDEILKGNQNNSSLKLKLVKLKLQLKYCEMNKLPTTALKVKIKEIEEECKINNLI